MPKLHAVVENLDDVPESLQELYSEHKDNDGNMNFTLNLADDIRDHPEIGALSRAHETQKEQNRELKSKMTELEKTAGRLPEGFDENRWEQLISVEKELKELKDQGSLDEEGKKAHEAEIASFKKTHEQQVERLRAEIEKIKGEAEHEVKRLSGTIHTMVREDGLSRMLAENGVKKEFLPFVQAKLRDSARVAENEKGEPTLVFETDLGEIPAGEYISKWVTDDVAKPFVEQQQGGGALGGKRSSAFTDSNPWSASHWSMAGQAEVLKKDESRANRMAKAAGHPQARGAMRMDAK